MICVSLGADSQQLQSTVSVRYGLRQQGTTGPLMVLTLLRWSVGHLALFPFAPGWGPWGQAGWIQPAEILASPQRT